ncbi:MAG TPA: MarR family transcriptional regulator [Cryptosporangiaceae bacterium]|nr:MarR family transcriptional regulator [Cryptosporangiaceae bacterium]
MSEPRWLDPTEMRAWRGVIAMNRLLFEQLGRDLAAESGLSMADYEVLVQLSEAPERRLRMTELAHYSLSSKSRLSHQIARMEEVGWVRREACPSDRRGAFAVLTDAGFATLAAAAPGHLASVRRHLFDRLTADDVGRLADILGKVNLPLEEADRYHAGMPRATACS